jgi:glycopeptide antibiotics resistance protein
MKKNTWRLCVIILLAYAGFIVYQMLFGFGRTELSEHRYNLIPFLEILRFLRSTKLPKWDIFINITANILVFIPFGILLPICFKNKFFSSFIVFEISIVILELLQLVTKRGSCDIDDIMLNSIGFFTGYLIFVIGKKILAPTMQTKNHIREKHGK